jgi:diguanylate cyclase (GGDEF)-like protein
MAMLTKLTTNRTTTAGTGSSLSAAELAASVALDLLGSVEPMEVARRLAEGVRAGLGLPWAEVVMHRGEEPLTIVAGLKTFPGRTTEQRVLCERLSRDGVAVPGTPSADLVTPLGSHDRSELRRRLAPLLAIAGRALANAFSHERMTSLAMTDCLTGLGTRRLLEEALAREHLARALDRRDHAVLVIDVDRFKTVNDAFGHAMGDQVLVEIARAIQGAVRKGDLVCRMGGDELCVLLAEERGTPGDADRARRVAERVRRAARAITLPDGRTISLSIGVAENRGPHWVEPSALMAAADHAAYEAKRAGGDAVVCRDPAVAAPATAEAADGLHPRRMVA